MPLFTPWKCLYFLLHVSVIHVEHQQMKCRNRRKNVPKQKNKNQTYIVDVFAWTVFASDSPTRQDGDVQKRMWTCTRTYAQFLVWDPLLVKWWYEDTICPSVCFWRNSPQWARASSVTRFLDHTRRITVGRTPLDAWSARRRDLYLTTHNTHNRQTSMPADVIRTHNLSRRAAADPRLRPRGHWYRRRSVYSSLNTCILTAQCLTSFQIRTCFFTFVSKTYRLPWVSVVLLLSAPQSILCATSDAISREAVFSLFILPRVFLPIQALFSSTLPRQIWQTVTRKDRRDSYSDRLQHARKQLAAYTCEETNPVQDTSLDSKSLTHWLVDSR